MPEDDYYREAKRVSRLWLIDGIFLIALGVAIIWPQVAHWLGWL